MTKFYLLVLLAICGQLSAQTTPKKIVMQQIKVAETAFDAWGIGERTGDYSAFKRFLSPSFQEFSHPLLGYHQGGEALAQMNALIASREKAPNQLVFSARQLIYNDQQYVFLFNSDGKVAGDFPYHGYNVIVLRVDKGKLTGFREYFGMIDPNWFK